MNLAKNIKDVALWGGYSFLRKNMGSKVLYYHDLFDANTHPAYTNMATPFELFKQHIDAIRDRGFDIVSKITKSENQVLIAFDDGWRGVYEFMDYFLENNFFPVISIPAAMVGLNGYLTADNIRKMFSEGFGIASHSWTHQPMTLYNNDEGALCRELGDSKKFLEDMLSSEISIFCYPRGIYSKTIYEKTLEYGYGEIFTCEAGIYYDEVFPHAIRRNLVQSLNMNELKWTLLGSHRILYKWYHSRQYSNS